MEVSNEEAEEFAKKKTIEAKAELEKMLKQKMEIEKEMEQLKVHLKAKFGDDINLEQNPGPR